jgi:hypothetical protein
MPIAAVRQADTVAGSFPIKRVRAGRRAFWRIPCLKAATVAAVFAPVMHDATVAAKRTNRWTHRHSLRARPT